MTITFVAENQGDEVYQAKYLPPWPSFSIDVVPSPLPVAKEELTSTRVTLLRSGDLYDILRVPLQEEMEPVWKKRALLIRVDDSYYLTLAYAKTEKKTRKKTRKKRGSR